MTRSQITCVQCMAYLTVIVPILVDGMRIPREITGLGRPRHYYRMSYKGQTIDTRNAALATSQPAENIASSIYSNFYENVITRSDVEELDITILLDSSISLGRRNYENGKSFLSNLVGMLPIRDFASRIRMSMYSFSESAQLTQEFGFGDIAFRELVRRHINEAQYHNGSYTHLTNALYWIDAFITRTARPASKKVLIVATDGKSNDDNGINSSGLNGPIAQLSEEGVEVFVVALGSNLDLTRIAILASQPDSSHIFHLRNTNTTNAILRNLATTVIRNRS